MRQQCTSKWIAAMLVLAFFIFSLAGITNAKADDSSKVIRVAFPLQDNLTEISEDGSYSGYTYEYLKEIAQYTEWEYEFVTFPDVSLDESLQTCLEMLQNGELDLMGGMVYNDALAEMYDYSGSSYGMAYTVLVVPEENTSIIDTNLPTIPNLRIAMLRSAATSYDNLVQFCTTNNIQFTPVYCDSESEQYSILEDGGADVMLVKDISMREGMRPIAKFSPVPFYFTTTKGNAELVHQLNSTLSFINETDPFFSAKLQEKYFSNYDKKLILTAQEKQYIQQSPTLRVATTGNKAPYISVDEETGEFQGISVDMLSYISENTGLSFTYVLANNQEDLRRIMNSGEADLLAATPNDSIISDQYNAVFSRPFTSSQVVLLINNRVSQLDLADKKLILPNGISPNNLAAWYKGEVSYIESLSETIGAVNNGTYDFSYVNSYSMQFYSNRYSYKNVLLIPQPGIEQEICIGVQKPADAALLSIINKSIYTMPHTTLDNIIFSNIVDPNRQVTLSYFFNSNPLFFLYFALAFTLIALAAMWRIQRTRNKTSRRIKFENKRYQQLCELSNECIFEYNYTNKELTFLKKGMRFFELDQSNTADPSGTLALQHMNIEKTFVEMLTNNSKALIENSIETVLDLADGTSKWFKITFKTIRDNEGVPLYALGKLIDIQKEKEQMDSLLWQAQMDSLTEIYNAATVRSLISVALSSWSGNITGALFILDIDHFKNVNDIHGHYAGDEVLKEIALQMKNVFLDEDIIGRLGGDEFIVYKKKCMGVEEASEYCVALRSAISHSTHKKCGVRVAISIGVALTAQPTQFDTLYKIADQALYESKGRGRDCFSIKDNISASP